MHQQYTNLPLAVLILDGWGISEPSRGNAISQARTPFFSDAIRRYQSFSLAAGGEAVGLPWGEPGNSEVGHQNLGAGKIVYQDVLKINKGIEDNSFFDNKALQGAVSHAKQHSSSFHIMGLLSDGGVHSHQDHLYATLELAVRNGLKNVFVHVFLDGRDTAFDGGLGYLKQLKKIIRRLKGGTIATVSGRFYAMDRDNHWERVEQVYRALVKGEAAQTVQDPLEALKNSYAQRVYDEEFVPCVITDKAGDPVGRIQPGDSVVFTNYRPDRARELTQAFSLPTFTKFKRTLVQNLYIATMTRYEKDLPVHVAFEKETIAYPVARVWSEAGLTQYHIAETEKYAHVTYFFNGGTDTVFEGQQNEIVPSAGVASYAEKPEMSAAEITKKILNVLAKKTHHIVVANFANVDMVGHSGNLLATQQAVEFVDACVKNICKQVLRLKGTALITADHGNAEEMVNWENGHILKEHSVNPVPCIIVGEPFAFGMPKDEGFALHTLSVSGVLSDATPTMLQIAGIPVPEQMTARSLIS